MPGLMAEASLCQTINRYDARATSASCGTAKDFIVPQVENSRWFLASVTEVIAASATPMGNGRAEELNLPEKLAMGSAQL